MPGSIPQSRGEVFRRLHRRVLDAWQSCGRPSILWMAAETGLPVTDFPDLRLGHRLTWRGAEAVLRACMVDDQEIEKWRRVVLVANSTSPAAHRQTDLPRVAAQRTRGRHRAPTAGGRSTPRREGPITMSQRSGGDEPRAPLGRARAATTEQEYVVALDALRLAVGRSFKQISETAGPDRLPRSTAHYMCRKKTLPVRKEQVVLFVTGCGEPANQAELWAAEWERLVAATKAARTAPGETTVVAEPVVVPDEVEDSPPAPEPEPEAVRGFAHDRRGLIVLFLVAQLLFTFAAVYLLR